jgi:dTDP-6-deoxy-L-talose 4-dehydrogenase (NAD+)
MTQRVLVTGATGFVGRHLVNCLLARGSQVVVMARPTSRVQQFPWFDRVQVIEHELTSHPFDVQRISDCHTIAHLAWPGLPDYRTAEHVERYLVDAYRFLKAIVEYGSRQILVTGTCLEYGTQGGCLSEDSPTLPTTPYGLAKDMLRKRMEALRVEHPFCLQWARLFYMYGEGQNSRSLFAQLDRAMAENQAEFNMSGGQQERDYLPVERVASHLVDLLESGVAGTFNVCSGQPVKVQKLVEERISERRSGIKLNLGYYPYPDYEPMSFWGNNQKLLGLRSLSQKK